jgi:hypothetical protein
MFPVMFRGPRVLFAVVLAVMFSGCFPASVAGQAQPPASPPAKSGKPVLLTIHIEVTAGENEKPVEAASVYVRFAESPKKPDRLSEMNVKTSQEGKVRIPLVPKGKILIQVIAPGWKTFGKWFDLTDDEQVFKIHLDKPPKWY